MNRWVYRDTIGSMRETRTLSLGAVYRPMRGLLFVLCTHQWNDLSCCILTNECTSWLVPWPVKTTWVEALLTMWSANLLYRLLLDYNRINEIQHCIFLYLKPVPTCCIKPKPFKICSYRNIKKRQNEDFQSNGGTYFLAHFCILYWKTKKVLPLCNYIDCSEGTLQCAVVQGMVKCSSFFFLL